MSCFGRQGSTSAGENTLSIPDDNLIYIHVNCVDQMQQDIFYNMTSRRGNMTEYINTAVTRLTTVDVNVTDGERGLTAFIRACALGNIKKIKTVTIWVYKSDVKNKMNYIPVDGKRLVMNEKMVESAVNSIKGAITDTIHSAGLTSSTVDKHNNDYLLLGVHSGHIAEESLIMVKRIIEKARLNDPNINP
jgi:hypothetical protein